MKKWRDWLRERWPHWRPFPSWKPGDSRPASRYDLELDGCGGV